MRKLRIASIAKSAGLSTARNPPDASLRRFFNLFFAISFACSSDSGTLAYTLIPTSSSCSADSIPLRKKTRNSTTPIEKKAPRTMPIKTTIVFLGLTGFDSATALSIMRTLPIALDLAMFNSCCRFRSCIKTARPDSTSRLNRNISC